MTTLEQNFMEAVTRYCKENTHKEIDWEQRRYEIARTAMHASIGMFMNPTHAAAKAVEYADALIEELKK